MSSDPRQPNRIAFDQPDPSVYEFGRKFPASNHVEDTNGGSSTYSSPSTLLNEADTILLDFGDWIDSDLNASWQSDGGDGAHHSFGSSQDDLAHYSFDMEVWSVMDNDKWPCFPG
jgi:hypothetical protein